MTTRNAEADEVYRLSEIEDHPLVRRFGLSRRQADRAISRGDLVAYKPGLYVMVTESAIRNWIEGSRTDADTNA